MSRLSRRYYGEARRRLVNRLIARDGLICALCKQPIRGPLVGRHIDPMRLTIDHKIPSSRGGSDKFDNLQLAHYICNHKKGNEMPQRVEGFPDLLEFQKYQDKQFKAKQTEEEKQRKLLTLRAERELHITSVLEIDKQIETLSGDFPAAPKNITIKLSDALVSTSGLVCAPDEVIHKYLKGMNGAKFQQINEHVVSLGYLTLRKTWMWSLIYKDLIYKEGNTRAAYWYAK